MTAIKLTQPFIPIGKIDELVQIEPALLLLGLAFAAWAFYKIFLRSISTDRHRIMRTQFRNLLAHLALGSSLLAGFLFLSRLNEDVIAVDRLLPYVGLFALISGVIIFIKVCRIITYDYLFLVNMKVQFPLLIVNLLTLLLSMIMLGWIATVVFNVQLASVLTTSAILSLVLGLALQDTLGNLFSGVALQFDKPYEIGDWIEVQNEVQNGLHKWIGQVREISWRATLMVGFTDEQIIIPNRVMGQSQISNFTTKFNPILRRQDFRIPFNSPVERVKTLLAQGAESAEGVTPLPRPKVILTETTESWVNYRLLYYIQNYGTQFLVADQVISRCIEILEREKIECAPARILVMNNVPRPL
jgi:small-conductance mechanosensitive channel